MNNFSRDRLFREFHKQTGIKPFSPEFIDSLVAVMRDPDSCLAEQVFAWSKWRSWGNSSTYAVSDWNPATAWRLDQTDCALDLSWFQEGRPLEWVEGMTKEYRLQMRDRSHPDRPKTVSSKQRISEAFTKNDDRGTITFDGQSIIPVVSPQQKTLQKFQAPRTFEKDPTFLEFWKVTSAADFQQWQSSCAAYFQAKKVARAAYQAYREHRTSEPPILIDVKKLLSTDTNSHRAGGRATPEMSAQPPVEETQPARPPEPEPDTKADTHTHGHEECPPLDTEALKVELAKRKIFTENGRCGEVLAELGRTSLPHFLTVLDDRLRRGQIGPGLLIEIAKKARDTWLPPPKPPDEDLATKIENWKWIAENDEDPEARDYAIKKLAEFGISLARAAP